MLDTIDYDEHLDNVRKVYKMKCDALLNAFHKYASSKVHLTQPTGGMFAWMTMPAEVNCDEFSKRVWTAM